MQASRVQHCNDDTVLLGKTTTTCITAWLAAAAPAAAPAAATSYIILLLYNMKLGVVIMRGHARKLPLMMIIDLVRTTRLPRAQSGSS